MARTSPRRIWALIDWLPPDAAIFSERATPKKFESDPNAIASFLGIGTAG